MLIYDPKKRPTASDCLQHPFFLVKVPIPMNVAMDTIEDTSQKTEEKIIPKAEVFEKSVFKKEENEEKKVNERKKISSLELMRNARYKPGVNSTKVKK